MNAPVNAESPTGWAAHLRLMPLGDARLPARVEALRAATEADVTDREAWLLYCRGVRALQGRHLIRDVPAVPVPETGPLLDLRDLIAAPLQGLAEAATPSPWANGPEYAAIARESAPGDPPAQEDPGGIPAARAGP